VSSDTAEARAELDRLLGELRPKLHRYCARMVGSVIDAEDVVQETLVKAIEAFPPATAIANVEGWLFRIVHNTALDFLRGRARQQRLIGDEDMGMIADPIDDRKIVRYRPSAKPSARDSRLMCGTSMRATSMQFGACWRRTYD